MKQILFFAVLISLTLFGCKKSYSSEPAPSSLDGKWRMTKVTDIASGLTTTKPSSISKDVDITFTSTNPSTGTFFGNTPTNDISKSDYTIGSNQTIIIPALNMTKVGETSWGILFVDNIRSSQEYSFEVGGLLNIETTNKILTFQKQ